MEKQKYVLYFLKIKYQREKKNFVRLDKEIFEIN